MSKANITALILLGYNSELVISKKNQSFGVGRPLIFLIIYFSPTGIGTKMLLISQNFFEKVF